MCVKLLILKASFLDFMGIFLLVHHMDQDIDHVQHLGIFRMGILCLIRYFKP